MQVVCTNPLGQPFHGHECLVKVSYTCSSFPWWHSETTWSEILSDMPSFLDCSTGYMNSVNHRRELPHFLASDSSVFPQLPELTDFTARKGHIMLDKLAAWVFLFCFVKHILIYSSQFILNCSQKFSHSMPSPCPSTIILDRMSEGIRQSGDQRKWESMPPFPGLCH